MSNDYARYPRPSPSLEILGWWTAVVLAALFLTCLHLMTTAPFKLTSFELMVHFDAVEPFQHRVLVPAVVASIKQIMPLDTVLVFGLVEIAGWITLVAVAHAALTEFRITRSESLRRALAFTVLAPVAIHLIVPELHMWPQFEIDNGLIATGAWGAWPLYYYPYDLPAAVFTLGLSVLLVRFAARPSRRNLVIYLVILGLGTCNRETTVFMIPFSILLLFGRMTPSRLLGFVVLQAVVFTAVEWPLHWLFSGQPNPNAHLGDTQYENHFMNNMVLFSSPLYVLTFLARFAGGLYMPVLLWWRLLDRRIACALLGFAVPLICFAMLVGRVQEHRIFIEAVPLIWLAALQVITRRATLDYL